MTTVNNHKTLKLISYDDQTEYFHRYKMKYIF